MINSSLHRIDWGKVIHQGVVVPCRVHHYSTLKHLTISGTYINLLSFAGKCLGGTTLPNGWCVRLTTYHHPVPLSRNLGALTSWNPLGLSRPLMGLLYLYLYSSESFRTCRIVLSCNTCDWRTHELLWLRAYAHLHTRGYTCRQVEAGIRNKDLISNKLHLIQSLWQSYDPLKYTQPQLQSILVKDNLTTANIVFNLYSCSSGRNRVINKGCPKNSARFNFVIYFVINFSQ